LLIVIFSSLSFGQDQDTLDTTLPMSLSDAHDRLTRLLADSTLAKMQKGNEEDMILYHLTLGRWIRNKWGLWRHNSGLSRFFDSAGVRHPDDMSGIILNTFWCKLNNRPMMLDERIQAAARSEVQAALDFGIADSLCPVDGSHLEYTDSMEKNGPPWRYYVLGECEKKHHKWVCETGKPLYRPDANMQAEFASKKFYPHDKTLIPEKHVLIDTTKVPQ